MLEKSPVTICVNPLKNEREIIFEKLRKRKILCAKTKFSNLGIRILDNELNIYNNELYKNGNFEITDEGIQAIAMKINPQKGDLILDFLGRNMEKSVVLGFLMKVCFFNKKKF